MFLFVSLCFSQKEPDFPIYIGAVNNINDTFMSHKLPGFHSCGKKKFPIVYSLGERMIPINFTESTRGQILYTHCSLFLDEDSINQISSEFAPYNYISFYYRSKQAYAPFFTADKKILTHYEIKISQEPDPSIEVNPLRPAELVEREMLNITFSLKYVDPETKEETTNILPSVFLVFSVFNAIVICIASYFLKRHIATHEHVPLYDIWRRPRTFSNLGLIASTGVLILVISLILYTNNSIEILTNQLIYNSMAVGTLVFSLVRGYIGRVCGDRMEDADFLSPCLFFYLFIMLPIRVLTAITNILGSFRGMPIVSSIIGDVVVLVIIFIFARGLSCSINGMAKNGEPISFIRNNEQSKQSCKWTFFSYVFSLISSVLLFPGVTSLINDVIYQTHPNYLLYFTSLLVYFTFVGILSIFRTSSKLKYGTSHWTSGQFSEAMKTSVFALISIIAFLVTANGFKSKQGILNIACTSIAIVFAIYCVGVSASFLPSFVFTSIVFPRQKNQ